MAGSRRSNWRWLRRARNWSDWGLLRMTGGRLSNWYLLELVSCLVVFGKRELLR